MTDVAQTDSPRRAWPVRIAIGAALTATALLVGLLLLEGVTRLVMDRQGMHFGIEMWKYARQVKRKSDDPNIGHEHLPGSRAKLMGVPVEISSQGLRDREYSIPKPADVHRIMILGDSMTFGWGARQEETYAKVFEKTRQESSDPGSRPLEVVNTGVGNYNTAQQVAWFRRSGLQFQPDVVLLAYYINDAEPTPVERQSWLAQHSYLYVFASSGGIALQRKLGLAPTFFEYYRNLYRDDQPGWQACQRALASLAATCREHRIALRMMLIPELHFPGGTYPFAEVHAQVAQVAEAEGVPALDLQHAFQGIPPRQLWVSPGDAHPNALAHAVIAKELTQWRVDNAFWYDADAAAETFSGETPQGESRESDVTVDLGAPAAAS